MPAAAQYLRSDVAADQGRLVGEVGRLEQGHRGRVDRRLDPLQVDLPVAGHADDQQLRLAAPGGVSLSTTFFSVSAAVQSARPPSFARVGQRRPATRWSACPGCRARSAPARPSMVAGGGAGVVTASVFAA